MTLTHNGSPCRPRGDRGYIGLSFSGGGYRATAFSLGTMALLQDLGLLSKARVMSSVSGGSLALGAFLCAKAGARLRQESDFNFYDRFWHPLMVALSSEGLANAFVRLPLLLQNEKFILHAADATQEFLNSLLGQEATLGNDAITNMLGESSISPDYVFFNAANISSLNLFRFGIQRGTSLEGDAGEPVYVLNRYYLQAKADSVLAAEFYRHARHIRLGDCVAASFAFPGGFEPLIFPDDYFRDDHYPAGREEAVQVRDQFREKPICDRLKYVALLDGGLYDNLGLASVEDIRQFLIRRTAKLDLDRSLEPKRAWEIEREQPIQYVIATDVDNIQPAIGSYNEPSLDSTLKKDLEDRAGDRSGGLSRRNRRAAPGLPWGRVLRTVLGVGVVPLLALGLILGLMMGVFLGSFLADRHRGIGPWWPWLFSVPTTAIVLALLVLIFLLPRLRRALAGMGRWLRHRLGVLAGARIPASRQTNLLQKLGFSAGFNRQGIDNDLVSWLLRAVLGVLRGPDRAKRLADLRAATLERRLGQLLPAFNGYLKRTRSLTYGYLQQTYGNGLRQEQEGVKMRCHLIRNMIFELIPGPDVDPDFAANLITLPVLNYRQHEDIVPEAPIMRKLSHANYVVRVLQYRFDPSEAASERLPLKMVNADKDLPDRIRDLKLREAASLWTWLTKSLVLDGEGPRDGAPNPTIGNLVVQVRGLLQRAMENAGRANPHLAEQLRQRCTIKSGEDATSYSWIPLVCEMATNLNTTLWVKGYRWYRLNKLEGKENRINATGGWYVEMPTALEGRPVLDLGETNSPAAAITALAGYLSTCFNLLEFFYASLGSSQEAFEFLVELLIEKKIEQWDGASSQDLKNLPYALRISTYNELKRLSRYENPRIGPGEVNLLEPWLTIREGFPDSWRQTQRNGSG